jgi:hypothetical protein
MFGEWYQKTNTTEDTNTLTLFVSSVVFVFWYHSPNFLDTPHIYDISRLRVNQDDEPSEYAYSADKLIFL